MSMNIRLFLTLYLLVTTVNVAARERPNEYALTAAYLHQLVKFINWPYVDPMEQTPLYLCVFNSDPLHTELQKLHLRKVQNREIKIFPINIDAQLSSCNIIYIHRQISNNFISKQHETLSKYNVLTLGEKRGFAKQGGIIELLPEDGKIQVEINIQAAKDAKINVSANLIEIASKVYYQRQL